MKTDTIAAIATAMTNSGIGIIRISGEDAFTVIDRIYQSKNGKKKLSEEKSHTVHYGYIVDDTKENKIIDEVMVLIMRAPNTYTREDTVEIDCHGGTCYAKDLRYRGLSWSKTCRTGRVYKTCIFKWKD